MNCNIIRDLMPLYIDKCCSEESSKEVEKHLDECRECKEIFDAMNDRTVKEDSGNLKPTFYKKVSALKASVLQSLMFFISFGLITAGVYLEAGTPSGSYNGRWAFALVVPATAFMLSLANWYFIRLYGSRKTFSLCSFAVNLCLSLLGFGWAWFHYYGEAGHATVATANYAFFAVGAALAAVFCIASVVLSGVYAKMLGKD